VRVLIAPDSFKGSVSATRAAQALAAGWHEVRPGDDVVLIPLADGGEGTLEALATGLAGAVRVPLGVVTGPDGRPVEGSALRGPDGTHYLEMAEVSGLPLMAHPDALGATSRGVGEALARCLAQGARRIVLGVGGSASTDGGAGALAALGGALLDGSGAPLADGGGALRTLASVDRSALLPAPADGLTILTDVDNPLLGPHGSAAVYGPQKGADAAAIAALEDGLGRLVAALGGDPAAPGAGAAGGIVYGLRTVWGADVTPGCPALMRATGFDAALARADVVITGEGRFDATSLRGKVVGEVLGRARRHGVTSAVVAGSADAAAASGRGPAPDRLVELVAVAGGLAPALADPLTHLVAAGRQLAGDLGGAHPA
jgi:glycerate 2-kinase